jgi:tetratricopeptide (TPR) repeat protein
MKSAEDYFDEGCYSDGDAAIVAYMKAIELIPDYSYAYFNRGTEYEQKDDFARAIADYRRFTELCPDDPSGFEYLASALLYATDPSLRDYQQAIAFAKRACELSGMSEFRCVSKLARAEAELGFCEEAILHQTKAIDLASKDREATDLWVPKMKEELEKYRAASRSDGWLARLRKLFR